MALNVRHLFGPTALIHAECFNPTVFGNCIKSGFREEQNGATIFRFKPELDQGRGFIRIVNCGIDRIWVPRERKEPLGLHLLHRRFPPYVLVARIGDVAARYLARHKWRIELHPKPFAELTMVRQRTPDAGYRCLEFDTFLYAIAHTQPPGCVLIWRSRRERATILLRLKLRDTAAAKADEAALLEQFRANGAADQLRGLVAADPGERCRAVEHKTHGRPSSR